MFTSELFILGLAGAGARLLDVPLGVLKTSFIISGKKTSASIVAFFEVLVYMLAAAPVFKNADKPLVLVMFCLGYAIGTYLGIALEQKLALGFVQVDIVTDKCEWEFADFLRSKGYPLTTLKGWGLGGSEKAYATMIIPRKKMKELNILVEEHHMSPFMTIKPISQSTGGTYKIHS